MANKKITDLTAKTSAAGDDLLLMVDSEDSSIEKKIKASDFGGNKINGVHQVVLSPGSYDGLRHVNTSTYTNGNVLPLSHETWRGNNYDGDEVTYAYIDVEAKSGTVGMEKAQMIISGSAQQEMTQGSTLTLDHDYIYSNVPTRIGTNASANELDDYEEGTWTPVINSDGGAENNDGVDLVVGWYVKVGPMVTLYMSWNATSTGASIGGTAQVPVASLPFTPSAPFVNADGLTTSTLQCRGFSIGSGIARGAFHAQAGSNGLLFRNSEAGTTGVLGIHQLLPASSGGILQGRYYTST